MPAVFVTVDRFSGAGEATPVWSMHTRALDEMLVKLNEIRNEAGDLKKQINKVKRDKDLTDGEKKAREAALKTEIEKLKQRENATKSAYYGVSERSFTLRGPDEARLGATLVAPEGARFHESINYPWWALVYASGAREYMVVMTVQKGRGPKPEIDGTGLGAAVTIGGLKVRFADGHVVFEDR